MPDTYKSGPKRGQRMKKHVETRRKDVEKAMGKPRMCPTCGQKVAGSAVGGAAGAG